MQADNVAILPTAPEGMNDFVAIHGLTAQDDVDEEPATFPMGLTAQDDVATHLTFEAALRVNILP